MIVRLALVAALTSSGLLPTAAGPAPVVQTAAATDAVVAPATADPTSSDPADGASEDVTVTEVGVTVEPEAGPASPAPPLAADVVRDGDSVVAGAVVDDPAGDRAVSDVLETDGFQTVGVTWPQGSDAEGLDPQVRTRAADGTWSDWHDLSVSDDAPDAGSPDAEHAVRGGTDPLWVGDADAVQVSFAAGAADPADMSLTLVDVPDVAAGSASASGAVATGTATVSSALYMSSSAGVVQTATGMPHVISREEWGARPQVCQPAVASSLVGAVVHHTADPNTYSTVAEAERRIRADQAYHIDARGWCDIGYNFVVDKWGNIYEGRDNSMTQAIIGVHAGGFNTGTLGVSMLGTYDSAPPAATVQAVAQIIGWRLGYYGINPQGTFTYHTLGGENSRYGVADVTMSRVIGHRDVAYTACPGNGGYAALPQIRSLAASYSFDARFAQSRSVVQAMYADILGRGVDPSGLQTWSTMLVGGSGLPALVASLTNSDEYVRMRISEAYRDTLGREPEPGGMDNWYRAIRAGVATVDDVERKFLSSGEFLARAGGTDAGYVERMYRSVLGRDASSAEVEYWSYQMGARGREAVTDSIWFSLEAAGYRAGTYYNTFLKRAPDAQGVLTWAKVLLARGEGAVRVGIAGSEEYRQRALVRYPVA